MENIQDASSKFGQIPIKIFRYIVSPPEVVVGEKA